MKTEIIRKEEQTNKRSQTLNGKLGYPPAAQQSIASHVCMWNECVCARCFSVDV